jgi:uroporphyrinogen decarboxylase
MGNIDPAGILRMGTPEDVSRAVTELLDRCSKYPNFVLSSGCDIPPKTSWKNIDAFFGAARDYYEK